MSDYTKGLIRQILTDKPPFAFETVYIGGGTPSLLLPDQLCAIAEALKTVGGTPEEFTVEVNPESVSLPFLTAAKECGVNRISMGVQSFDDTVLHRLGRLADSQTCLRAYDMIRAVGFDNVSLDLMLAVPGQTDRSLDRSLQTVCALDPEHISAYLLKIEPNTVFGRAGIAEADEEIQRRYYLRTVDVLTSHGYSQYEISNFGKAGKKSRHNSAYWQSKPYRAYGAGAYGFDGKTRYHIAPVREAFAAGNVQVIVDQEMDAAGLREEHIMLSLRTSDGIEKSVLNDRQTDLFERLIANGLARRTTDGYALTAEGFLVSDAIIVSLLEQA